MMETDCQYAHTEVFYVLGGINDRTTAFVGLHSFTVPNQLKVHLLNLSRKVSHIAAKGQVSVRG